MFFFHLLMFYICAACTSSTRTCECVFAMLSLTCPLSASSLCARYNWLSGNIRGAPHSLNKYNFFFEVILTDLIRGKLV